MIILLLSNAVLATENNKNRLNDNVVSHADIDVRNEYNEEGNRVGKRFFSTNHHSVASQKKNLPRENMPANYWGIFAREYITVVARLKSD